MNISELQERTANFKQTAENILATAARENRSLTAAEQRDVETLIEKVKSAAATLRSAERLEDLSANLGESIGPMRPLDVRSENGLKYVRRDLRPGEVRMVRNDEAVSDSPYVGPGLGEFVKGIVTGRMPEELRAMGGGTLSAGGYSVPTPLASFIIDKLRSAAVVLKAGALTIPMTEATLKVARLTGDVTAAWKAENAAITASDNTFDQVTFTAHTLVALAKLSVELVEDSANIDQVVGESITKSLALELDRVCLYGSGSSNQPTGIKNQSGVTVDTTTMGANGGSFTDYSQLNTVIGALRSANLPGPFGVVISPRTEAELSGLQDTLHQPLRKPDLVGAAKFFATSQVPNNLTQGTASTASDAFIAQWDQLMIGMRTSLMLEISREAADATSSAFGNLQVWVRAYLRADVQLAHAPAFYCLSGIL